MIDAELIAALAGRVRETVSSALAGARDVALVDFPNHSNVGDSAIWLGELQCLASLGVRIRYSCDHVTFHRGDLTHAVGRGPILLHGGGNLGDLWPEYQRFREDVVASFPDNPVIQLPQSIYFRDPRTRKHAAEVLNRHPNLTLLVRDTQSHEMAAASFHAVSQLCPDSAFCLGPLRRSASAEHAVLWLTRTDLESTGAHAPEAPGLRTDWLDEPKTWLWSAERLLARQGVRQGDGPAGRVVRRAAAATFGLLARRRLARGVRLLSSGHVVVTDRLHGHILCLLLGIPHVLLDNVYGKLRAFHETWTTGSALARRAERSSDAMVLAVEARHACE